RLAESYCQSLDHEVQKSKCKTRYITVRFGNVLGSNGSVVPLFQKQMEAGGPITITHPDIIRFFMTIREAVELVLQGASIGLNSKTDIGKIFVLDMGEPVKIVDLAHQMITLAGLHPNKDIKIVYTGLRPGEKLFEELFYGDEALDKTIIEGIMLASPRTPDYAILNKAINELNEKCLHHDIEKSLAALKHLVPEYQGRIDEEINKHKKLN
ncbi:MAG: polysaccharide biosynthesis protein, partial [Alphaproteobacteria bacterium]|nr:polysaccharide biosynthesis protein [Alphaproteobacteria bacterium]